MAISIRSFRSFKRFGMIADNEVKDALREFLAGAEEDDYLKRIAIFVLRTIGVHEPLKAVLEGKETVIEPNRCLKASGMGREVASCCLMLRLARMNKHYDLVSSMI